MEPDFTEQYHLSVDSLIHGMVNEVARQSEALQFEVERLRKGCSGMEAVFFFWFFLGSVVFCWC